MPGAWLGPLGVAVAKLGIALATMLLLLAGLLLRRAGRPDAFRRGRDALLGALGILGALGWWNFLGFGFPNYLHVHDGYHYFVGARYFSELGYTRLYTCTVVADIEAGAGDDLEGRRVRNLETNFVQRGSELLKSPEACKAHFTPERWEAFSADLSWFRNRLPQAEWRRLQMDHGFNGSPVWLLAGSLLASGEGGAERSFFPLSLIDPLLLVASGVAVVMAFGWRTACVAAVFWGTNTFADYSWTGGSFLRQDWLAALVVGIACLRAGRPFTAGALLMFSTLLRVFPAFAVAALVAQSGQKAWQRGTLRPSRTETRFAAGCLVTLALLVPLSAWQSGPDAWTGFVANSRKLLGTPLLNQMGLRTVVAYQESGRASALENMQAADPYLAWKLAQRRQFAERIWLFAALAAIYVVLLLRALPKQEEWVALALGAGAIPIATQLTSYYHAALVGLALLWVRREAAGVAVCALAAASMAIAFVTPLSDERFVWTSLAEVVTVLFVTALFGGNRATRG
jgi:hypothetical protein